MAKAPTIQTYNPGMLQTNAQIPNAQNVVSQPQPRSPAQLENPVVNVVTPVEKN